MKKSDFMIYLKENFVSDNDFTVHFVLTDCHDGVNDNECFICPDQVRVEDDYIVLSEKNLFKCFKKSELFNKIEKLEDKEIVLEDKKGRYFSLDEDIEFIIDGNSMILDVPLYNYMGKPVFLS
jgi:hypothetical protein